jgi:hypothetical protein
MDAGDLLGKAHRDGFGFREVGGPLAPVPTWAITASIKQLPQGMHTQTARDSR